MWRAALKLAPANSPTFLAGPVRKGLLPGSERNQGC